MNHRQRSATVTASVRPISISYENRAYQALSESVKNKRERPRSREEQLESALAEAKQLVGDQAIAIQAFKKKLGLTGR